MATKKIYIGDDSIVGWVHVEKEDALSLPNKKCSVQEIFVDRVLEDIPEEKVIPAIQEWRRVLEVGGRFTIVFSDVVKAVFLYQRRVISHEQLHEILAYQRSSPCLNWIEGLLIMRYADVYEAQLHNLLKEKKIWETILIAQKGKNI